MLYSTTSYSLSSLKLARICNANFKIIEFGDFTPILEGHEYVLAREEYVENFMHLPESQIKFRRGSIKRISTGEVWENYFELEIKNFITPDSITSYNKEVDVWLYNSGYSFSLFVSLYLKQSQEKSIGENILRFSEGFSHFA